MNLRYVRADRGLSVANFPSKPLRTVPPIMSREQRSPGYRTLAGDLGPHPPYSFLAGVTCQGMADCHGRIVGGLTRREMVGGSGQWWPKPRIVSCTTKYCTVDRRRCDAGFNSGSAETIPFATSKPSIRHKP